MVKLVVYDFDGVLTDNRVWVDQNGVESVACNRSDGWWIAEIRKLGVEQLILTTELNPVVLARGRKVTLEVLQAPTDKLAALQEVVAARRLSLDDVAYVGNEMNDYECLRAVTWSFAPSDSHPRVLGVVKVRLPVAGGQGVVRHIYEWLVDSVPAVPER